MLTTRQAENGAKTKPDKDNSIDRPEEGAERIARIFAALSNPVRIEILRHIAIHRFCCCKDITGILPLAQSTVSQHLKVLAECGIIRVKIVPPRSQYCVNEDLLKEMAATTSGFLDSCCGKNCRK